MYPVVQLAGLRNILPSTWVLPVEGGEPCYVTHNGD